MFTPEQLLTVAGLVLWIEALLMLFRLKSLIEKYIKELVWRGIIYNIIAFIFALIGYWIGLAVPFVSLPAYMQPMLLTALAATMTAIGAYEVVNNVVRGASGKTT